MEILREIWQAITVEKVLLTVCLVGISLVPPLELYHEIFHRPAKAE